MLVLDNGAYCKRAARLTTLMGRRCTLMPFDEGGGRCRRRPLTPQLAADPSITRGADPLRDRRRRAESAAGGRRSASGAAGA